MTKYTPLYEYLVAQPLKNQEITLSFAQIERILGSPLPKSAVNHRAWWANEYSPGRHVQARAWLEANWKVDEVDQERKLVSFRQVAPITNKAMLDSHYKPKTSSKYWPITEFLLATPPGIIAYTFSFSQVELILGDRLPNSARRHRPWWANERTAGSHVQAHGWLAAGWKVDSVDLYSEWVRFRQLRSL